MGKIHLFFIGPLSRSISDHIANTLHHVIHIRQFCLPYINFKMYLLIYTNGLKRKSMQMV